MFFPGTTAPTYKILPVHVLIYLSFGRVTGMGTNALSSQLGGKISVAVPAKQTTLFVRREEGI